MTANPSTFDFSKYVVSEDQNEPEIEATKEQSNEPFDFSKYVVKEPTALDEGIRHVVRTASRGLETAGGFARDVYDVIKYGNEQLPEFTKSKSEPNFVQKAGQALIEKLPSSEDLRTQSIEKTGGYTAPQSELEEIGDEVTSLATTLLNPTKIFKGAAKFISNLGSSFLKAGITKGAGKGAELLGADESQKRKVELGTLLLTGFMNKKSADAYVSDKYKTARSLINPNDTIRTRNLYRSLSNVEQQLQRGISTPTKDEVLKKLKEFKTKASHGRMTADELVETYHNINENLTSKKLFDELNTSERRLLKHRYDLFKNEVGKEIGEYGKTNPEFYKEWQAANEGYATIAKSKGVSNYLESKLGKMPKHLVGSLAIDVFLKSPYATAGVVGTYGIIKASEFLYRLGKSKTLQDHYRKVIMEAGNENLKGVINNLSAMNKILEKPIQHNNRHQEQLT